jgi:hypothetical protein
MLVMMVTLAPLTDVMQLPTNVFTKELNALIMMFAPSTNVLMEFAIILKRRIAMITILAPLTLAILSLDANMLQSSAETTTLAQLIVAM